MNGAGHKGGAYGFKVTSINKLVDTKSANGSEHTLLHFLAKTVAKYKADEKVGAEAFLDELVKPADAHKCTSASSPCEDGLLNRVSSSGSLARQNCSLRPSYATESTLHRTGSTFHLRRRPQSARWFRDENVLLLETGQISIGHSRRYRDECGREIFGGVGFLRGGAEEYYEY